MPTTTPPITDCPPWCNHDHEPLVVQPGERAEDTWVVHCHVITELRGRGVVEGSRPMATLRLEEDEFADTVTVGPVVRIEGIEDWNTVGFTVEEMRRLARALDYTADQAERLQAST